MGSGNPEGLLHTHIIQQIELVIGLTFPYSLSWQVEQLWDFGESPEFLHRTQADTDWGPFRAGPSALVCAWLL